MKKNLLVKVAGIKNENLKEIKKVDSAIETIKQFARKCSNLSEDYWPIDEQAILQGEEDAENNLYMCMTVEVEGLEDIMGNIATLTEKLKTEIRKMDKAIMTSIGKEPVER